MTRTQTGTTRALVKTGRGSRRLLDVEERGPTRRQDSELETAHEKGSPALRETSRPRILSDEPGGRRRDVRHDDSGGPRDYETSVVASSSATTSRRQWRAVPPTARLAS